MEKLKTYKTRTPAQMKYAYPVYDSKMEYDPGMWGWEEWENGETNCTNSQFYLLPDGTEYVIFKLVTRTMTGGKRARWEVWHNGRFSNNYFSQDGATVDDAIEWLDSYIKFNGLPGKSSDYIVYPAF